jgi:hypothetical protein
VNSAGTGGGLRYVAEETDATVVNQEQPFSCQVACARQLLKDAGFEISEYDLLAKIGYIDNWGTNAKGTAKVLDELHPHLGFDGGAVNPNCIVILFRRDPWIASLLTDFGRVHAVIVDRLEADVVHVRDPWGVSGPGSGAGTRATIPLSDFMEHWDYALNNAVFPNRAK